MPNAGDIIRASDVSVQACRVTRNAAQSITHNASTVVNFDTEIYDTDGMHSTSVNTSRITIVHEGIYVVGFTGSFAAAADYTRVFADIRLNGTTSIVRQQQRGTSASDPQIMNPNTVYQFSVADYIEVLVFQFNSATAARNLEVVASRSPEFYAARIGS